MYFLSFFVLKKQKGGKIFVKNEFQRKIQKLFEGNICLVEFAENLVEF